MFCCCGRKKVNEPSPQINQNTALLGWESQLPSVISKVAAQTFLQNLVDTSVLKQVGENASGDQIKWLCSVISADHLASLLDPCKHNIEKLVSALAGVGASGDENSLKQAGGFLAQHVKWDVRAEVSSCSVHAGKAECLWAGPEGIVNTIEQVWKISKKPLMTKMVGSLFFGASDGQRTSILKRWGLDKEKGAVLAMGLANVGRDPGHREEAVGGLRWVLTNERLAQVLPLLEDLGDLAVLYLTAGEMNRLNQLPQKMREADDAKELANGVGPIDVQGTYVGKIELTAGEAAQIRTALQPN